MEQILVVDDEVGIRELLSEILRDEGFFVDVAENASQARAVRSRARPDLVLLDIWMPDTDGITLLREWASSGQLTMPVVMMSGHATIDTAVEATRIGAFDFLEKPIALQKLLATVERALRHGQPDLGGALGPASPARSPAEAELRQKLDQLALSRAPVLLSAEPGVDVERVARFLRAPSTPWVVLENPAALANTPLDLLQQASQGLLFVPEVAQLSRMEQRGLQLVLGKLDKYRVRLVSATTRSPGELAASGFDAVLLHQLSGVSLRVPPLREHREDIPELATQLLGELMEAREIPARSFTTGALNALRNHDWPGNLVQLRNAVRSLALNALTEEIDTDAVSRLLGEFGAPQSAAAALSAISMDQPLREARDVFERLYLEHHIALEKGNMSRVADKVGLERTHLYRKLKQLGIALPRKAEES